MSEGDLPAIGMAPVESWNVEDVKPYPHNHKIHTEYQVQQLANSIKGQGLNDPITVDTDGVIIGGHGRLLAVKKLGWKKVPVRVLNMISKDQADKLRIAANKTSSTEYDYEVMQRELARIGGVGLRLDDMGFDEKELEMMVGSIGEIDMDIVSDDITKDVKAFEEEAAEYAKETEGDEIQIAKAIGVKKLPIKAKRHALAFMSKIEQETGLEGAEALIQHMKNVAYDT